MQLKERLILAGLDLIEKQGITGFTVRNVASACGVSCAAPYKHFKDKDELLDAIKKYVQDKWIEEQNKIEVEDETDVREMLVQVSMAFIRFLTENPNYRTIIILMDENKDEKIKHLDMSGYARELVSKWCQKSNYTYEQTVRKSFVVRAFIFGAVSMFVTGELEYNEENMKMVEKCVRREFDLD